MTIGTLKLNKLLGENEQNKMQNKNLQYDRKGKEQNTCPLFHLALCPLEKLKVTTYCILKKLGSAPPALQSACFLYIWNMQ